MATLKQPKSEKEIRHLGVTNVRKAYLELATDYERIINNEVLLCPKCNTWQKAESGFYYDKKFSTSRFPICKRCIMKMVEQRVTDQDEANETKESVQKVLQMMDRCYDNNFYEECVKGAAEGMKEKNRISPFATYITALQSLPQWKNKFWADSDFGNSENISEQEASKKKARREIQKLFGSGFSNDEYLYLQDQYDDWCARTQVDTKSQQTYIVRICFKLLDIWKAQQKGEDTSRLDDSLNKLMEAAKLQPKQNVTNAATDSLTFGELIAKWEAEKPIPEPDPELVDPSNIRKNLRVWFAGWLGHALGLNIPVTQEYEEEVAKYTVNKQEEQDQSSSALYGQLFGVENQ